MRVEQRDDVFVAHAHGFKHSGVAKRVLRVGVGTVIQKELDNPL